MSSKHVLDTNVLIYLVTKHKDFASRALQAIKDSVSKGQTVYLPAAVVAEVLYVLEGSSDGYTVQQSADAMIKFIVNKNVECQDHAAVLYALQVRRDKGLDFVDGYCAGIAIEDQMVLITNDGDIPKKTNANVKLI